MLFSETELPGAWVLDIERREDERGFFARTFCERELEKHGIVPRFPQCNLSRNTSSGTLRGMHFERGEASGESKIVRCVAGAIYDVIVDLRDGSPTRLRWVGFELSAESARALFIPAGFAHGFLTLTDHTDVFYHMGDFYRPDRAAGFRFDDPVFGIEWPRAPRVISERDRTYPDFDRNAPL